MFVAVLVFGLLHLCFAILAYSKIRNSKEKIGFVYQWAFFLGAFVWEDLLLISFFTFLICIITLFIKDIRIYFLVFSIFWIVRSLGETIYFFLQQFIRPDFTPHEITPHISKGLSPLFGEISNQKSFILLQVYHQLMIVISATALVLLLQHWNTITPWF